MIRKELLWTEGFSVHATAYSAHLSNCVPPNLWRRSQWRNSQKRPISASRLSICIFRIYMICRNISKMMLFCPSSVTFQIQNICLPILQKQAGSYATHLSTRDICSPYSFLMTIEATESWPTSSTPSSRKRYMTSVPSSEMTLPRMLRCQCSYKAVLILSWNTKIRMPLWS